MKIKIDKLDILFSKVIRLRAKETCERCLKPTPFARLQCSHFHGRRKRSTRWNPDNAAALCFQCHQHLGENPLEHTEWFTQLIGEGNFLLLRVQANQIVKVDRKAVELYLKQRLGE